MDSGTGEKPLAGKRLAVGGSGKAGDGRPNAGDGSWESGAGMPNLVSGFLRDEDRGPLKIGSLRSGDRLVETIYCAPTGRGKLFT